MELKELKSIWKQYDAKLEHILQLNIRCLHKIQAQKVRSKLRPFFWGRMIEILINTIFISWLAAFTINNINELQFSLPAIALVIFFGISTINCIRQVILIKKINLTEDIISIQKKLTSLQYYFTDYVRFIFLFSVPTYLAWPIIGIKAFMGIDITSQFPQKWWIIQIVFTGVMIPVCIWLYKITSYKYIDRKWVSKLIEFLSGSSIRRSMQFTKELIDLTV